MKSFAYRFLNLIYRPAFKTAYQRLCLYLIPNTYCYIYVHCRPSMRLIILWGQCIIKRSDKTKSRLTRHRFPQKMNKRICFDCFIAFHGKQKTLSIRFLGESTARPNCFWFYLIFSLIDGPHCLYLFWTRYKYYFLFIHFFSR